jgi:DNA polymerase-1
MYDHIQEAIAKEECLLEWDGGPNHEPAPAPLLKDKFASERRKAKVGAPGPVGGWTQRGCPAASLSLLPGRRPHWVALARRLSSSPPQVLNFSIAYGKTAHGLSKDWGVSIKEAEETLKRWYADRPEVSWW